MPIGATTWTQATGPTFAPSDAGGIAPGVILGANGEPVTVVRVTPSLDFATGTVALTTTAIKVMAEESARRIIRLRNYGSDTIVIARSEAVLDDGLGYPLKADESLLMETAREIWAAVEAGGTSSTLAILAEYEIELDA